MAVALLWHLHQPEYRHPATGRPVMPWTRLHALRGYLDLLTESVEQEVPWTLNVVPGLWEQLAYYADGGSDDHLDLTQRAADTLDEDEQAVVRATFPCGNPRMRASPRYRALEQAIADGERLTPQDLRDLQVLSTLVWTGSIARRDHPGLVELLRKGEGFTEDDKGVLLAAQAAILRGYPNLFRRFAHTQGPALSTTPLHHPILPLLVDLAHAERSVGSPPPTRLAVPGHAREQLVRGKALLETVAGRPVYGCWPSEGAVSPEVLPLIADAGFRWLATDEEVLARSDRRGRGEGGWDLGHGLVGFFRDRALSDRVGFDYARWQAADAVEDFFRRAVAPGVRLVALDGENPWEAFEDGGAAFRAGLIGGLRTQGLPLDAAAELPVVGRVDRLHTGSWIGANLEIWAGSPQDHAAWALLAQTIEATGDADDALPHLLAAEGSDWFWWYGPEFDTPFADVFDEAFREHLRAAWVAAGREPPAALDEPIRSRHGVVELPARPLAPALGEPGWFGAGRWCLPESAMAHGSGRVIELGFDTDGAFWMRGPAGIEVQVDGRPVLLSPTGTRALPDPPPVVELVAEGRRVRIPRVDWVV